MTDHSAVMVPPDASAPPRAAADPKPAPSAPPPPPPAPAPTEERARKPRRPRRGTQISPGVIVIAVIAGAAGAAAQAWFDDLAEFVWHLRDDPVITSQSALVDLLPADVTPSDFSSEEAGGGAQGSPLAPAEGESQPVDESATGEVRVAEAAPPEGSAFAPEAPPDGEEAPTLELAPADRVRLITWEQGVDSTVITLWGNGSFLTNRVSHFEIPSGQPRMLIKLRGIDVPYRETVLALGTTEVVRLRTGFHPQSQVNELHLVLDLAASDVGIERMERGESSLSFHLGPNTGAGTNTVPAE